MDFLAIDFETATAKRDSACSVAVIEVHDGKLGQAHYTLLQPPNNKYDWRNIQVHGIRPQDTANAPSFARLWPQLARMMAGKLVVAHNASFDMGVMRACIQTFRLQPVDFRFCCTVKLARSMWPELPNHKLNTVGDFLGIDFNHHNALDDAKTCAQIPLRAAEKLQIGSFKELEQQLGVYSCPFYV